MADSGSIVPGLSNKYNSQATIEKIMNKKREKVDDFAGFIQKKAGAGTR